MTHFEKYQKLIQKQAWKYAKKWKIEYEEMEAEGYAIYCKALHSWDPTKASFITHLYFELMNLNTFGREMWMQEHICDNEKLPTSSEDVHHNPDWLEEFKKELSEPAYDLLVWILSYEWWGKMKRNRKLPTLPQSARYFNSTEFKMKKYWNEIKQVWQRKEKDFTGTL